MYQEQPHQRVRRSKLKTPNPKPFNTKTRYYLNNYEEEQTPDGKTRKIHYLSGGNGLAAIYVETDGNGQLYYAYTDYLGSLTALTDVDGEVVERQAFDPCSVKPVLCKARGRGHWLN